MASSPRSEDDELALTATAVGAPTPAAAPAAATERKTLGRFRIERMLGEGGMGVVHAAFDPELERRVALKVLRHASNADARARLLREARAMAKLSHAHVITVFEVGSADGEDFVAMELIDGETLGEWVRRTKPEWRAIVEAFVAAGRGLAAAHAEGLVHRDFKPNNVLRSRAGKIVVTDFGLARSTEDRGTEGGDRAELAESGPVTKTATGAMLGTPAYMAPEQWAGADVDETSDQFAFCVALWEALAGTRPYGGTTIEELRTGVLRGPAELPTDAIPRSLRPILKRGLATDPKARWPNMTALLGELENVLVRRRRFVAGAAILAAAGGVGAFVLVATRPAASEETCVPPRDPNAVWSPARAMVFAAVDRDAAALVGADMAAWREGRAKACAAAANVRTPKLGCFDAVLERLDAVVTSAETDRGIEGEGLASVLVDPAVCDRDEIPHLTPTTPELANGLALLRRALGGGLPPSAPELAAAADRATAPCVRTLGLIARLEAIDVRGDPAWDPTTAARDVEAMSELVNRCDDEAVRSFAIVELSDAGDPTSIERGTAAVAAFPVDDRRASLEITLAERAQVAEHWDEASAHLDRAIELFGHRHRVRSQLDAVRRHMKLLLAHGRPEDLARVTPLYEGWRPIAARFGIRATSKLDATYAKYRWTSGDIAGADNTLTALRAAGAIRSFPAPVLSPMTDVKGQVVDAAGAPVPGAYVAAAFAMVGDAATIASPMFLYGLTSTHAGPDGRFAIAGARGTIIAQSGDRRSLGIPVAAEVVLVVEPTGRIEGRVTNRSTPPSRLWAYARALRTDPAKRGSFTMVIAPIRGDGTYALSGVPRGKVQVGILAADSIELNNGTNKTVDVGADPVRDIAFELSDQRIHVVAHSLDVTRPDEVMVWVFPRFVAIDHPTLNKLSKEGLGGTPVSGHAVDSAHAPPELLGKLGPDDLVVTVPNRPAGQIMVCAFGVAKKQISSAGTLQNFGTAMLDFDMGCTKVAPDQQIVNVDVPSVRKIAPPPARDK